MTLSQVSSVVSLTWIAVVVGNGSYILAAYGHDLHSLTSPFMSQNLAWLLKLLICLYKYSLHEKLTKNMGPHCTVRPKCLLVAFWMALTLEPIKSLCTISTMRLVFLLDGLAQSPSEAVPLGLREGLGVRYSLDRQSVALWEEVVRKSLCILTVL